MTREQCRAARGLLNWTTSELAERAHVGRNAISGFETGRNAPRRATLKLIQDAFEAAGVEFIENGRGPGVRLVKNPDAE